MTSLSPDQLEQRIDLVAIAPARNIRRRYAITTSYDLFGHVAVELHRGWYQYARAGQGVVISKA
jgi:hypothetical protein